MLGFNGGLIGATRNTTSQASVSGIWTLGEQLRARRESLWPVVASTYFDPYASFVSLFLKGDGPNASTTFIDSSPAPKTVTAFGNAQISTAQSKFGGASMLFAGGGDYLSTPDNEAWNFGSGEFTIEFWTRPSGFGGFNSIVSQWPSNGFSSSNSFVVETVSNNTLYFYYVTSSITGSGFTGPTLTQGQWQHIAIVRSGNNLIFFKDGVQHSTHAFNVTLNNPTSALTVGGGVSGSGWWNGYIDDLRITKGVARYTANFTPTYEADPYASSTVLLLKGNGTNGSTTFVDSSDTPKTVTAFGNAQISTAQSKFGGASIYLDGTGDYLGLPSSSDFTTGTGNFTLELWYYPVSKMWAYPRIFQVGTTSWGTADNWAFLDRHNDANTKFSWACVALGGNAMLMSSSTTVANNKWYHLAVVRDGSTFRLFVDGVQEDTYTNTGAVTSSASTRAWVGSAASSSDSTGNGYIDDLRFTKGIARYTANFTPPGAL